MLTVLVLLLLPFVLHFIWYHVGGQSLAAKFSMDDWKRSVEEGKRKGVIEEEAKRSKRVTVAAVQPEQ